MPYCKTSERVKPELPRVRFDVHSVSHSQIKKSWSSFLLATVLWSVIYVSKVGLSNFYGDNSLHVMYELHEIIHTQDYLVSNPDLSQFAVFSLFNADHLYACDKGYNKCHRDALS